MPSDPLIGPLDRGRAADAVALAVDAFAGSDPAFADLWPDERIRRRAFSAFFTVPVRDALDHGRVDAELHEGRLAGFAVWLPPGAYPLTGRRQLRAVPAMLRTLAAAPGTARRLARFGAHVDERFARRRAWYLQLLAVAPDLHGCGVGSRLLRAGLARVDAERSTGYLETSRLENVGLYERHGFVVEDPAATLVPDGPTHWLMSRPPAA